MEAVACSSCGKALELVESDPDRNHWFGTVCLKCKMVFCSDCNGLLSFHCPRCGGSMGVADRAYLQKAGLIA